MWLRGHGSSFILTRGAGQQTNQRSQRKRVFVLPPAGWCSIGSRLVDLLDGAPPVLGPRSSGGGRMNARGAGADL
eukprot:g9250.t1